jgi:hypothetical protein
LKLDGIFCKVKHIDQSLIISLLDKTLNGKSLVLNLLFESLPLSILHGDLFLCDMNVFTCEIPVLEEEIMLLEVVSLEAFEAEPDLLIEDDLIELFECFPFVIIALSHHLKVNPLGCLLLYSRENGPFPSRDESEVFLWRLRCVD